VSEERRPLATVVVPSRDRARVLDGCLRSLVAQDVDPGRFDVLVVDNGSVDGTGEVVTDFARSHPRHSVRLVREEVPGLLAARHRAALDSSTPILCFVDDDIVADPGWLRCVLEAFDSPDVHLVGGPSLPRYEREPPPWIEMFRMELPEGRCLPSLSLIDFGSSVRAVDPWWVWGLNFSIRRETLFAVGGFHPDAVPARLSRFRGDGEGGLALKLLERGYRALYHPGARVEHVIDGERLSAAYFRRRRFLAGISASYSLIRRHGEVRDAEPPRPSHRERWGRAEPPLREAAEEIESAYARGFAFHAAEVRAHPELREWVLRPSYLPDFWYGCGRHLMEGPPPPW
jgi:glycosyltransferase involved in cell wall biosynthesis